MSEEFDVIVVGAGIQGAGVAQAAAAAGYRVKVLEQYAGPAQGSSSRSTKLIHGGLRYLETGQFSLVRECLKERATLLKNAPDLVRLVPFIIPVYADSERPAWMIRIGLMMYSLLGSLRPETRFKSIPKSDWVNLDGISTQGLKAVFQYYDGQTDDAKLTASVLESAREFNAEVAFDTTVERIELGDQTKVVVRRSDDSHESLRARVVVNAAGPWVNNVMERVTPVPALRPVDLVEGTHIVVPGTLTRGIYYVESPDDQRVLFILPWKGNTMIGTTEVSYHGHAEAVEPSESEIEYLLRTLTHYFPNAACGRENVLEAFAGLRVLPDDVKNPNKRSRDTLYHLDQEQHPRMITVYGGKLTAYRAMAQTVLAHIQRSLPLIKHGTDTRDIQLRALR